MTNNSDKNESPGNGGNNSDPGAGSGHGSGDQVTIVVNGRAKKWMNEKISYDELVAASGLPLPSGPNPSFTIIYHNGPEHSDGTVMPGQSIKVRNGMVFNVTPTNQS